MYINNERKFIFICCAKSASTSVLNTVRTEFKPDPPPHIRHMSIETVLSKHPDKRDYFKFAFVRNPWDRIVSCYHDFTQDTSHWSWSKGLLDYKTSASNFQIANGVNGCIFYRSPTGYRLTEYWRWIL